VFGKFWHAKAYSQTAPNLWVDTTPGTPMYGRAAFMDRFYNFTGYEKIMKQRIMFGTDCFLTNGYSTEHAVRIIEHDTKVTNRFDTTADYFAGNVLRFLKG